MADNLPLEILLILESVSSILLPGRTLGFWDGSCGQRMLAGDRGQYHQVALLEGEGKGGEGRRAE